MRQHHKNCIECNTPFTSKRSDAKYCSGACKQIFCLKNRGLKKLNFSELLKQNHEMKKIINGYLSYEPMICLYLPEKTKSILIELGKIGKATIIN
jgi:hypothetical protein